MFLYTTEIEEDNMYKKKDEFFFIDRTDEKQYQEIKQAKNDFYNNEKMDHKLALVQKIQTTSMRFQNDPELELIMKNRNRRARIEFNQNFNEGHMAYIKGDWQTAVEKMNQCKQMNPDDGPTNNLYKYMSSMYCNPPSEWKGVRALPKLYEIE